MANEEKLTIHQTAAKKRIEFIASTTDAFLQDFMEQAGKGDRLGCVVACARLAQLGQVLVEEYASNAECLVTGDTDVKVYAQACDQVVKMFNRNSDECQALIGDVVPDTTKAPTPDRSLS